MAFNYRSGLGNSAAYLVSGHPWITGSINHADDKEYQVSFPAVAKSVTVINRGNPDLRVHFNSCGGDGTNNSVIVGRHYVVLDSANDSVTFNVKCKEIYISRDDGESDMESSPSGNGMWTLFAELTSIEKANMYNVTGSGLTEWVPTGNG